MFQSKLAISSTDYYSCELTEKIPVKVSILCINGDEGLGIVESLDKSRKDLDQYIDALKQSKSIKNVEVTHKSDDIYWTRVIHQLDYPSIHETVLESGSMGVLPIIIQEGIQYHTIFSPTPDIFRVLLKKLKERFTSINVRSLSSHPVHSIHDLLTPKQLEAFVTAHNAGYYAIPKKCKISDLAKNLGLKRVTYQERLKRAESRIMEHYGSNISSLFSTNTS